MIRPKIKWSSLKTRIERIERAKCPKGRVFVMKAPYERPSEERLARTYARMREEFGYVANRDLLVRINQFCCEDEGSSDEAYEIICHRMIN
jgi:hypothetical protein